MCDLIYNNKYDIYLVYEYLIKVNMERYRLTLVQLDRRALGFSADKALHTDTPPLKLHLPPLGLTRDANEVLGE